MARRLVAAEAGFDAALTALLSGRAGDSEDVRHVARAIVEDVRARGDQAVIAYTEQFDRLSLTPSDMRVTGDAIAAARGACPQAELDALMLARDRIAAYHERQLPADFQYEDSIGVTLGARWRAIQGVGLYVPGGLAAYPSSVLMSAVPARVAGVERLAMVVPCPDGVLNPLVLAAADIAGVDEIYRIGGAQAVGALAYGTATIAAVDLIVGPGNAYVSAAKREVFGSVGIDLIAGPSEVLVVADNRCDPAWVAMDLLSQAEHDAAAQSILITDDGGFADAVCRAVEAALETLPRRDIAKASWEAHGACIVVGRLDEAVALVDRIAPEHLELACDRAEELAGKVKNAGAIFVGRTTPEAVGDYIAGPSHVLPTSGAARFSSGLGVLDFMKRTSIIGCSAAGLSALSTATVTLATAEGLGAHGRSVSIRTNQPPGDGDA